MVERVLPSHGVTRFTGSYCLNCGLAGKPSDLKRRHYNNKNTQCSIKHLRAGTVIESPIISRVRIPEEILSLIIRGEFVYGNWNDPKERRISRRKQSIEELSCQVSGNKMVSLVFLDVIQSMM